ncbi:MAG: amino acid permease [Candidatus Omnitrophica bacterium]|nr:amino acid permease [Candidatus Omnitrophota bacterium]
MTLEKQPTLIRSLGLLDSTLLVIGCIVGVGIFRTSSAIASHVSSPAWILALWAFGGILSLCGALCYAELAAMFPKTGGDYVYLTKIYGGFWGFLFGWTKLFVERTGTIAVLGFVFAEYVGGVLGYGSLTTRWVASAAVALLTGVNVLGIRWGKTVQNTFTVLKIAALGSIVLVGLMARHGTEPVWTLPLSFPVERSAWQALGVALIFVLWTYGGWTEAAYVAEEIHDPQRAVPRALVTGLLITTALYVLVNGVYLAYVSVAQMPRTPLVAATMMQRALGPRGATLIASMVAVSAFGALNGYILTGARILYAIAQDHPLFAKLGSLHPRFHTPAMALWLNAGVAIVLIFTKTFDQIMTYSTVVISVFFTMAVAGVIVLRRQHPTLPRPYKAWGYPVTPILFILVMVGFILDVCVKQPAESIFGFGLMALGVPLYRLSQRWPTSKLQATSHRLQRKA